MLFGFAALWSAAGILTLGDELWMPLLAFLLALVSAFVASTNLMRPAVVRLDVDGVHFRHWRIAWFVAWTDIAEVTMFTLRVNGVKTQINVIVREHNGTN